jgi:hypothetical protein
VGDQVIAHFDGTAWTSQSADAVLYDIWGTGPNDVWAAGRFGLMYHFDGTQWTRKSAGTGFDVTEVVGSGGTLWLFGWGFRGGGGDTGHSLLRRAQ